MWHHGHIMVKSWSDYNDILDRSCQPNQREESPDAIPVHCFQRTVFDNVKIT